ncbi:MAG: hypothetical protein IKY39_01520, partial [Clostridia bacterium]|nr:hypothetical protein [Clostridia bacterium]
MKKLWTLLLTLVFVVGLISPAMTTTAYAQNDVAMTVNGTEYTDHGTGWSAAIKLSKSGTETTVKLFADWIADAEKGFVCPDGGTKNGALHVGSGKFILDLNGYTLDRNADKNAASYASSVLYVNDCTFTLVDTSAEQDGKITGGYSEKGGGIYAEDANLYINSGNITGNKSVLAGGGIHVLGCEAKMNGGSVTDNESEIGGGIYSERVEEILGGLPYGTLEVNGGLIARNTATYVGVYGGGGGVYLQSVGYMNGGIIEENYASGGEGGGVFVGAHGQCSYHFIMNNGVIRNNIAYGNGGGIAGEYFPDAAGDLYIVVKSGLITGNVALNGNGGGIWYGDYAQLYLYDCTITGNAAPGGYGGGVYISSDVGKVVFGGTVIITDNTAHMSSAYKVSNIFAEASSKTHFEDEFSVVSYVSARPLNADSKIGVSVGKLDPSNKLNPDDKFPSEIADCFFSDDPRYLITKEASGDKYYLHLNENPDHTHTVNPIFVVETATEGKKDFYDHNDGWSYAVEMSKTTNVKITLYDDWFGSNGSFQYYDKGTTDGALYISGDCKNDITIDLNGHTIDRKAREAKKYGCVFYMDTYGSLTIVDSSEEKTGKITGGNIIKTNIANYGAGGAFYVDYGTLYLKGGSVTGN